MTIGMQHRKTRSKRFITHPCEPCGKETPFQNQRCLYCGAVLSDPFRNAVRERKEASNGMSHFKRAIAGAVRGHQMSSARREYWKRKAEENRAKWEGKS